MFGLLPFGQLPSINAFLEDPAVGHEAKRLLLFLDDVIVRDEKRVVLEPHLLAYAHF